MTMKIDISDLFATLKNANNCNLVRVKSENSVIGVFYGKNEEGNLRLAFLSKTQPVYIDSTAALKVIQWAEDRDSFWTCFDLVNDKARQVYFKLGNDLIEAAFSQTDDKAAMNAVKNRFFAWKKMFQRLHGGMSEEIYKGLFGELFVLKHIMIPRYGVEKAIHAWSGPDRMNKDFSIGPNWREVKTTSVQSTTVTITSLAQLDSSDDGILTVVKVEKMSEMYDDGECTISELMDSITELIGQDSLKEEFLDKLASYGYLSESEEEKYRFSVSDITNYVVKDGFPRLRIQDVPFSQISAIKYELILPMLEQFKEN